MKRRVPLIPSRGFNWLFADDIDKWRSDSGQHREQDGQAA
jgi:hypothetical protein